MKQDITNPFLGAAVLLVALFLCQTASAEPQVMRLRDRQVISFQTMMDEVHKAQIIFIGEGHSFPSHHELQLEIIRTLKREGKNVAVGLEMFQARSQDVLDQWGSGAMDDTTFISQYYANWSLPWSLYKDIFLYLRDRRIPSIGLNVPHNISRKVASTGFGSLSPEELRELPPGVACNLDPEYMAYVRKVYKMHERRGKREFQFFCEAQVLWEQAMAWYLQKYREKHPETTVVVLSGINHAMKPGIPRQLVRRGNTPSIVVIVPEVPDDGSGTVDYMQADYMVLFQQSQDGQ